MKIVVNGSINFIPVGNVALPDYGQRRLETLDTIEQERIIMDSGGSLIGMPFSVSGVLSQSALASLSSLTNAAIGTYSDVSVAIYAGVTVVWSGTAYPQQITGVSLYGGQVLYADPALGILAGDRLAAATINFMLKAMT